MLRVLDPGHSFCDGLTRREWLRVGGVVLGGLTLAGLGRAAAERPAARAGKARAVIVFGLIGGPPQHETWDPKPGAPTEVRGAFGTTATATPGLRVGELMPRTARLTGRIAVLRAVCTNDNAHSSSGYQMMTGVPHQPPSQESATPRPPNNAPNLGAVVRALRADAGRLPAAVTLPEHIWNDGNFPWPGQDAGLLGSRFNPWLVHCDPSARDFHSPDLALPGDVPPLRFDGRRSLLDQVNRHLDGALRAGVPEQYGLHARRAFDLLSGPAARKAFDVGQEPDAVRARYGRGRFAQSVLLARRLVEAGVTLVQVNWTRIQGQPNQGGWDTHAKHSESLKGLLMPMMDQAYSALLEDLQARGLLDETLVVWFGEFGRTPKFNGAGGRDHWGQVFSLALAGGGVRGGVVHGASDRNGAFPLGGRVEARDLLATVYHCLGHGPDTEVLDALGRPIPISRGRVINAVL
jgi:hypothetical protein